MRLARVRVRHHLELHRRSRAVPRARSAFHIRGEPFTEIGEALDNLVCPASEQY